MNKIIEDIEQYFNKKLSRVIYIILIFCIYGFFKDCGQSSTLELVEERQEELIENLNIFRQVLVERYDSLLNTMPDTKTLIEIQLLEFEKNGLKIARNILYDESSIDRQKVDRDEVMAKYDGKIEEINKIIWDIRTYGLPKSGEQIK